MTHVNKYIFGLALLILSSVYSFTKAQEKRSVQELQRLLEKSNPDSNGIKLLLEAGFLYTDKQNLSNVDLDSALYLTDRAWVLSQSLKEPKWKGKCLVQYSRIYRNKGETKKGLECIQKAISTLYMPKQDLGDAYLERVWYYNKENDEEFISVVKCYEQAAHYYNEAGCKEKYADALRALGRAYIDIGENNSNKILDTLNKALTVYKQINSRKLHYVYDVIGQQYGRIGSYNKSLNYSQNAVKIAEALRDTSFESIEIYSNLGMDYCMMHQYSKSYPYLQKALRLALSYKDIECIITANRLLISTYYMANENDKAIEQLKIIEKIYPLIPIQERIPIAGAALISYARVGQIGLAKPYLQQLIEFSHSRPELEASQAYVYTHLIIYYLRVKQYKEAQHYCVINDRFCKHYSLLRSIGDNYLWWSEADRGLGDFDQALTHYKQGTALTDSIFMGENRKQIAELQVKFETEKKEQSIKLLTEQTQLQQASLYQSRLIRNILLCCALMLVALLILGYSRYRIKQKANTQLRLQQDEINDKNTKLQNLLKEKEWLIKEIHHRVKNNLQIVMSLLNTQALYLNNKAAVAAINESQQRMQAMSLIHQKLYQNDSVTSVAMQSYIYELIDYLKESVQDQLHLQFKQNIELLDLDISQAIPVGLILNEAITNSIKYAFPNDAAGTITITMKLTDQKNISLEISDDGIGLSKDFDQAKNNSLGMSLMRGLTNQLGGFFNLKNDHGLKIEMEFPYMAATSNV